MTLYSVVDIVDNILLLEKNDIEIFLQAFQPALVMKLYNYIYTVILFYFIFSLKEKPIKGRHNAQKGLKIIGSKWK